MFSPNEPSIVAYHVRVVPARHELEVVVTIPHSATDGVLRLRVPTWVPGAYDFEPYGRDVFAVRAEDVATGVVLAVHREGWQGYRIEAVGGAVRIHYRASCTSIEFSETCGVLGDRNGVLLGTRYLQVPAHRGEVQVTYELPDGWALHHPSGARRIDDRTWAYPSYEMLLDTPVVMGAFDRITRDVRGTPFHHVFLTRGVGFSTEVERFVDSVVAVAERFHEIFGAFPFADYTFVLSLDPNDDWGLEHLTSTMIGLGPDVFIDPDQRAIGVRTCAHELFHAWNVRRLRPAPLDRLDLERGSFTDGLWLSEGFTRYYEFLACTRTGIYSPQQFFSAVVNYYEHLAALPAYRRVSPIDASAATFLNHDQYPGQVNGAIDYYDTGMVIAFDLDVALRCGPADSSLDQAFSAFYREYVGRGAGWTTAELREFLERIQPELGAQLAREAEHAGALTIVAQLERLGFTVNCAPVPYCGLVLQDDVGPAIFGVLDDSPAGNSGIAAEDVITAVEGYPFALNALKWVCANQTSVTLDVLRGRQRRTYAIPIARRTRIVGLTWAGDDAQATRISAWLGQPFAPRPGEPFLLDFYENFHGIETVL